MASEDDENVWIAASDGNLEKVQEYIRQQPHLLTLGDENGYTCMHAAAAYGHRDLLLYLLDAKADINVPDSDGDRPLHHCDLPQTAELLISLGADVNARNNNGQTPDQAHLAGEEKAMIEFWKQRQQSSRPRHRSSKNKQSSKSSKSRTTSETKVEQQTNPESEAAAETKSKDSNDSVATEQQAEMEKTKQPLAASALAASTSEQLTAITNALTASTRQQLLAQPLRAAADGKVYVSWEQVTELILSLVPDMQTFRPDLIIAIGGGGFIPARILRTVLHIPILAIALELYT
eukprot:g8269.t1